MAVKMYAVCAYTKNYKTDSICNLLLHEYHQQSLRLDIMRLIISVDYTHYMDSVDW